MTTLSPLSVSKELLLDTLTHRVKKFIRFDQFTAAAKWIAINKFYPVSQTVDVFE